MSDFSDLGGVWALSEQLAIYRTMDSWKQSRAHDDIAADNAALRHRYSDLAYRYNELLKFADEVERRALRYHAESGRKSNTIDEQDILIRELQARVAKQDHQAEIDQADIAYLRVALDNLRRRENERNPGSYPMD